MKSRRCVMIALVAAMAWQGPAMSQNIVLTLDPGNVDRENAPVRVPIELPKDKAGSKTASVLFDGQSLAGQITAPSLLSEAKPGEGDSVARELVFIVPNLKAKGTVECTVQIPGKTAGAEPQFSWQDKSNDFAELRLGNRPVLRYMYKALDDSTKESRDLTYKIYHHVYDPEGTRLVTKGPGGLFPHHRGLFYGFNKVTYGGNKQTDVWHCTNGAYQSHDGFMATEAGPVLGRHRLAIGWHGQKGELFAKEEREITVYNVPGGQLIEFASRVRSTGGKVRLDGDPQHAGFHFRADNEVASKTNKETYYLRPDGKGKPGETRNWEPKTKKGPTNLPWNAMSFVIGDQRYTCAYLDRPGNPKESRFSERDYGRFGSYFEYDLTDGRSLDVNYRVWLQRGEMTGAKVDQLDGDFIAPIRVTRK